MRVLDSLRRPLQGSTARFDRRELAGAFGDLGTFLPLLVGMTVENGLDFASGLFFAGLFNVVTGLVFRIPMAVQPMKAIAAVALTEGLRVSEITAAGATVSAFVLVLGISGLIDRANQLVPKSVVRGLQLALGLSLLEKGLRMATSTRVVFGADSYLTAILAALVVVLLARSRRVPAALVLLGGAIALAIVSGHALHLSLTPWWPRWSPPGWQDVVQAFPRAAVPQIPLTTLNSVVAVCALSADLFPDRAASPRRVAISVGLMNLVGACFGAMPLCHGAGGLAGQVAFGARTNGAVLFLGALKMTVAVLFGATLMEFCRAFPGSILGVLLAASGIELALVTRDQKTRDDAFVMLLTAGACTALHVGAGFVVGMVLAAVMSAAPLFSAGGSGVERPRPPHM
jgi:MFS superfamily sulfate permease-like transporter